MGFAVCSPFLWAALRHLRDNDTGRSLHASASRHDWRGGRAATDAAQNIGAITTTSLLAVTYGEGATDSGLHNLAAVLAVLSGRSLHHNPR